MITADTPCTKCGTRLGHSMAKRKLTVHKPECPPSVNGNGQSSTEAVQRVSHNEKGPVLKIGPMPTREDRDKAFAEYEASKEYQEAKAEVEAKAKQETDAEIDARYLELRSQLLDVDGLSHITPPEPLIENWLYRNSLAWIGGKPGHAKSFIAVEMGCCVATGTPWHGHKTEQGTVLYIIAEGASGLHQRIDAWAKEHGVAGIPNLHFLPVAVRLADTDLAAMALLLADIKPDMVIIDTQARVTVGLEENSAKDMGRFVDNLDHLRQRTQSCVLTVHHTPRSGDNLRGSIALEGAADTVLLSTKDGDQVTISNTKQKNAAEQEDMELVLEWRPGSAVLVRPGLAHRNKLNTNQELVLKVLAEFPEEWVSSTKFKEATGLVGRTFYRTLNPLINRGLIEQRERGNRKDYRLVETNG